MRISDWSSDVCSSDLQPPRSAPRRRDPWRPHRVGDGRRRRESGVQGPSRRAGDGSAASATDPAGKEGEACGLHRTGSRRGRARKSVVKGKSGSVRLTLGGRRNIQKKKKKIKKI